MSTHASFSFLTILMLTMGWLTHWLVAVRKAIKTAQAAKTSPPSLVDYWIADVYTTVLSVIAVIVLYFGAPYFAAQWPDLASFIGSTAQDPLNPLAAYLGGIASPWIADAAGKRISAMVGDGDT